MKIRFYILCFILIVTHLANSFAQIAIPKGYFISPLSIGLAATGSFSEVRGNHFHSGFDFAIQQKEGLPVFAVADGFVARMKVSAFGFGNALYVDHPNGFTSVYAHLQRFNDTLTSYLRTNQYRLKSFEVDLFPKGNKELLFVKKGQIIGYAGNSGSSGGPHLHFELRNTRTERIINPILFGLDITDHYAPYIDFIKIYPENRNSFAGNSNQAVRFNIKSAGKNEYRLATDDTIRAWGNLSFGVQAFDYHSNQSNRNGFYSMKMYIDNSIFYSMVCDSFAFAESRYVNACIDFAANYNNGNRIVKSKRLPGNRLSFVMNDASNGVLAFTDTLVHEVLIAVADLAGNAVNLRFWIKPLKPKTMVQVTDTKIADSSTHFRYNKANTYETTELKVEVPAGSLYEDLDFRYRKQAAGAGLFSDVHYLHSAEVPLHTKIKVAVKATKLPPKFYSKALLVRVDRDGKRNPAGGSYENGYVSSTTNLFDGYAIVIDTVAPTIKASVENSKSKTSLKFTVSDNFSGIKTYKGTVNGKWALVEWDPKNKLMVYRFDFLALNGRNTFTLSIEDEKGNKSEYSTTFTR